MSNELSAHQYIMIDIKDFNLKSGVVNQIFDYIIQDTWQVTSISAANSISVGYGGANNFDPVFQADINGSMRITEDCHIKRNLYVTDNINCDTLTVNNNASFNNDLYANKNLFIAGNLTLANELINNDLTVLNNTNAQYLNVSNNASINTLTIYGNSSFLSNVNISSLNVSMHTDLYELNVSTNASIYNLYVSHNSILNKGLTVNNASTTLNYGLYVNGALTNINYGLNVTGLTQLNTGLIVTGITNLNTGLHVLSGLTSDTLTVTGTTQLNSGLTVNNNLTQLTHGLTVTGNNTIISGGLTVDTNGPALLKTGLTVTNNYLTSNDIIVIESTKLNTLRVTGKSTYSDNMDISKNSILSNSIVSNYGTINDSPSILTTPKNSGNFNFIVNSTAYIDTLFVNTLNIPMGHFHEVGTSAVTFDNVNSLQIQGYNFSEIIGIRPAYKTPASFIVGGIDQNAIINLFGTGSIYYGFTSPNNISYKGYESQLDATFDLKAKSAYTGITYDGPINIGQTTPDVFNLNSTSSKINLYDATGQLHYDGSIYIGQHRNELDPKTILDIEAEGTFIYDGMLLIGQESNTVFDLSASYFDTGITYNGPININQQAPYTLNINGGGVIDYEGIFNLNGICTIDASNCTTLLEVNEHSSPIFMVNTQGNTNILGNLGIGYTNVSSLYALDVLGTTRLQQNILVGGNITSYSDKKLKDNIIPLNDCLDKIQSITGYYYTRNDLSDTTKKYVGLIAQEVEELFPELVSETNDIKSINYQSFAAILIECVKELNTRIKILENKILS